MTRSLMGLLTLVTALSAALFPHNGTVTDLTAAPLAGVRLVSRVEGDTTVTLANGRFGDWKTATATLVKSALAAGPQLSSKQLSYPAAAANEPVVATILNLKGQQLWRFAGQSSVAGTNQLELTQPLADGLYILQLAVGESTYLRKMRPTIIQASAVATASRQLQSRVLPHADTLILSKEGYLRTTRIVPAGTLAPLTIAMIPTTETPTVAFETSSDSVLVGEIITLNASGTDLSGNIEKYIWAADGQNYLDTADATRSFTFTVADVHVITVKAVNEYGAISEPAACTLTVIEQAFAITATEILRSVSEDGHYALSLADLAIVGGATPFTIDISDTNGHRVSNDTLYFAKDFNGETAIDLRLIDSEQQSSNSVTIPFTVLSVNDVPNFTLLEDLSISNQSLHLQVEQFVRTGTTPLDEAGQTMSYSVTVLSGAALLNGTPTISALGTLQCTLIEEAQGEIILEVQGTDDGGTANSGIDTRIATAIITVTDYNHAPYFITPAELIPTVTVAEGDTLVIPLQVADKDNEHLTLLFSRNEFPWASLSPIDGEGNATLTLAPDMAVVTTGQTEQLVTTLAVTDGIAATRKEIIITVHNTVLPPPSFTILPNNTTAAVGTILHQKAKATDYAGRTLQLTATGLPGISADSTGVSIPLNRASLNPGEPYLITISATDDQGQRIFYSWTITTKAHEWRRLATLPDEIINLAARDSSVIAVEVQSSGTDNSHFLTSQNKGKQWIENGGANSATSYTREMQLFADRIFTSNSDNYLTATTFETKERRSIFSPNAYDISYQEECIYSTRVQYITDGWQGPGAPPQMSLIYRIDPLNMAVRDSVALPDSSTEIITDITCGPKAGQVYANVSGKIARQNGASWDLVSVVYDKMAAYSEIHAPDSAGKVLYLLTNGEIARTTEAANSAATFVAIPLPFTVKQLLMLTPEMGWVHTTDKKVYFTNNGFKEYHQERVIDLAGTPLDVDNIVLSKDRKSLFLNAGQQLYTY